ncbi:MAG TPA: transposase family protein, partial [Rectinema sp.]|nr:transposase family protein [Rectinema sp.]
MEDKELYEKLLGVKEPWDVIDVTVDMQKGCVAVKLGHPKGTKFPCPVCGELCAIYDHEKRRWRHLDSCGF